MNTSQSKAQLRNMLMHQLDLEAQAQDQQRRLMAQYLAIGGQPEALCALMQISKATLYRRLKGLSSIR